MLAAVVMCTHFRSYLRGAQFTTQNRSQFAPLASEIPERRRDASPLVFAIRAILSYIRISSGVTARKRGWYVSPMWSVPTSRLPGVGDGFAGSRHRPEMGDQLFATSEIGESMDAELLPELSGKTWVASELIEEFTADLLPAGSNVGLIKIHSGMGGLCWALSGISLLAVTSWKFVH